MLTQFSKYFLASFQEYISPENNEKWISMYYVLFSDMQILFNTLPDGNMSVILKV